MCRVDPRGIMIFIFFTATARKGRGAKRQLSEDESEESMLKKLSDYRYLLFYIH